VNEADFIQKVHRAADRAGHPYPAITAAEAAFETGFGCSALATRANNLFGLQPTNDYSYAYPRVKLFVPAMDRRTGKANMGRSTWVVFPDYESCLRERYEFLKYRATWDAGITEALRLVALQTDEDLSESYIRALSKNITGPADRADRVLAIAKIWCAPVVN
jgi:flagellum-specific peptidoglycan hydrolase FlgJ